MQWYLRDKRRLRAEIELMEQNGVNFELYTDDDENLLWKGPLYVSNHYHGDVRLVYSEIHPFKQMTVFIMDPSLPCINLHVHQNGTVCYIRDEEWSPEWTALAVYLTAIRFLSDYYSGDMGSSLHYSLPHHEYVPREPSLLDRLTEAILS